MKVRNKIIFIKNVKNRQFCREMKIIVKKKVLGRQRIQRKEIENGFCEIFGG